MHNNNDSPLIIITLFYGPQIESRIIPNLLEMLKFSTTDHLPRRWISAGDKFNKGDNWTAYNYYLEFFRTEFQY